MLIFTTVAVYLAILLISTVASYLVFRMDVKPIFTAFHLIIAAWVAISVHGIAAEYGIIPRTAKSTIFVVLLCTVGGGCLGYFVHQRKNSVI